MQKRKTLFFVEAIPLVEDKPSGVSHAIAGLIAALASNRAFTEQYEIVLIAPKRGLHKLDRWPGISKCSRKGLPLRMKIINGLIKFHLLPPMDILLGRGVYLFGNFKNWPVTKRSLSLTYIHDMCYAFFPEFVSPKNQQFLMKNVPRFIKQTNYIITVSESAKKEIVEYYGMDPEKIVVLYNGVDRTLFKPHSAAAIKKVKKKYEIAKDYFLFVGNIEPRKNLANLIRAFRELPKDRSLVLVGGSGWLNEEVLAEIDRSRNEGFDIIKPATFVPDEDVAALISGAVAMVHPAFHEGFGMPPVEAMATGTPLVVSDIPSLREVIADAGVYANPLDVADIAKAMKYIAHMKTPERDRLLKKGIIRAEQFSWQKSGQKLMEFLQEKGPRKD